MSVTPTQLSLLEALEYKSIENTKATNRMLRNYYVKREGIGLNFFNLFGRLRENPGLPINRKTISKAIRQLAAAGLVKVDESHLGKKRLDIYQLTEKGRDALKRQIILYRLKKNVETCFDAAQAKYQSRYWVVTN
jgi:DNA-binding MarR family transcriptional regulator